jgi:hypothetical protein
VSGRSQQRYSVAEHMVQGEVQAAGRGRGGGHRGKERTWRA